MSDRDDSPLRWDLFISELIGTAVLVLGGLSLVIFAFGAGSPVAMWVPSVAIRRSLTGFLFGTLGASISLSPVGKVSGSNINPSVTLGFWLAGKFTGRMAFGYVVAQVIGAIVGALPLLAWGEMGRSMAFGASLPGPGYPTSTVLLGEVLTTFGLISGLCIFLGSRRLRPFTPLMSPCLYAIMVPLEAAISGTSTNPARSFGPALVSGQWQGWWIYWVGPALGTLVSIVIFSFLARRIEVAKVYHFASDRTGIFHRMRRRSPIGV
jgi:aquaporin Z